MMKRAPVVIVAKDSNQHIAKLKFLLSEEEKALALLENEINDFNIKELHLELDAARRYIGILEGRINEISKSEDL
jgi:phage terminase large subunit-like protein